MHALAPGLLGPFSVFAGKMHGIYSTKCANDLRTPHLHTQKCIQLGATWTPQFLIISSVKMPRHASEDNSSATTGIAAPSVRNINLDIGPGRYFLIKIEKVCACETNNQVVPFPRVRAAISRSGGDPCDVVSSLENCRQWAEWHCSFGEAPDRLRSLENSALYAGRLRRCLCCSRRGALLQLSIFQS